MVEIKKVIVDSAMKLESNYKSQGIFEIGKGERLPKRSEIIDIINEIRRVIFPGYFGYENTAYVSLDNFAGSTLAIIYEKLFKQIRIALMFKKRGENLQGVEDEAEKIALEFISKLPKIQSMIFKDLESELQGDPAASSKEEIIFSYPGIYAIFIYRIAHVLY